MMTWTIYLAGEIHSDWRDQLAAGAARANLPVAFLSPVTDHTASDDCGINALGPEAEPFWKDHKGAKVNAIRTRALIDQARIVVVKFGDKYRQWNAAFDAGYAFARGKSLISLHDPSLDHALKELDAAALAVARDVDQLVNVLAYVTGSDNTRA